MSLRDQLLAKGLVSKKRARSADRDKKRERKREKGSREKKRVREAAAAAAQEDARDQRREAQRNHRERSEERARTERALQVRQILAHHRVEARGRVAYHHTCEKRNLVGRLWVNEATAFRLRNGELAIVLDRGKDGYAVVPAAIAERLRGIAEGLVVWHVRDTTGLAAPDLAICRHDGEVSLHARRYEGPSQH